MIKISELSKNFGRIQALKNINLEIKKGEFFGLLGPNGAGKSTLMNTIIGYLEADSGTVVIDDELMTYENISIRKKLGYVPQEIALYNELSAEDNLKIFGRLYGLQRKTIERKIDESMELVQLSERKGDRVKEFSGGMKRRLNLAASLLNDPPVLLCDEPTVGVDPQSRNAIFEMLQELNHRGKTIVYTTHYMEEAEKLCSRLAIIDHGEIIARGTLGELLDILPYEEVIKINNSVLDEKSEETIGKLGRVEKKELVTELFPNESFLPLSRLFGALEETGIESRWLELKRATLEDVFLNLTGRKLRD